MFCPKCGNKVEEDAVFCGNCGAKLVKSETPKVLEETKPKISVKMIVVIGIVFLSIIVIYNFNKNTGGSDFESDEETFNLSNNVIGNVFDRSLYYTGISRSDLLRYPDTYIGSYVKFGRCYVLQVIEEKLYVVNNGDSAGSDYIIIDDRNNSGANALEGDQITVFGSFSGIGSYGTTSVPIITADRMVVNNLMPTDFEELAQALVNGINHNRYLYKSGETTYLGGASIQWVMAIYGSGSLMDLMIYDHEQGTPLNETYVQDVDGYDIFMKFKPSENLIAPIDSGAIVEGDPLFDIFPIRVNGTLGEIKQNPFDPCIYDVTFIIESFEPYDSMVEYHSSGESDYELSDFSCENLFLYSGNYENIDQTSIRVNIYSSFDEGNIVGNVFLYDSLGHETFASIRDDNEGEGIYTLCLEDSRIMYIGFYEDYDGEYYADIQGLNAIYQNANEIETYVMTEQYIP